MTTPRRPALVLFLAFAGACDDAADPADTAVDTAADTAADGDSSGASQGSDDGNGDGASGGPATSGATTTAGTTASADDGGNGDDGASADGSNGTDGGNTTGDADEPPPQGDAALRPWLADGSYLGWAAESGVHTSAGPHGMGVRTFVNDVLFASLSAGNAEHPVGAAIVKELYDGDAVGGWAVMRKLATGQGGDGWYWYEVVGDAIYADDTGVALCTGCHGMGTDYVRTPFPLQ